MSSMDTRGVASDLLAAAAAAAADLAARQASLAAALAKPVREKRAAQPMTEAVYAEMKGMITGWTEGVVQHNVIDEDEIDIDGPDAETLMAAAAVATVNKEVQGASGGARALDVEGDAHVGSKSTEDDVEQSDAAVAAAACFDAPGEAHTAHADTESDVEGEDEDEDDATSSVVSSDAVDSDNEDADMVGAEQDSATPADNKDDPRNNKKKKQKGGKGVSFSADGELAAEEETDAAAVPRSAHETPLTALPVPTLPHLMLPPTWHMEAIGTLLHIQDGAGWDAPYEGDGAGGGRRGAGRGRKRLGGSGGDSGKANAGVRAGAADAGVTGHDVVTLVVAAYADTLPLDEGTLLCTADQRCVGFIEDVFGPVASPLYLLRVRQARAPVPASALAAYALRMGWPVPGSRSASSAAPAQAAAPKDSGLALLAAYDSDEEMSSTAAQAAPLSAADAARAAGVVPSEDVIDGVQPCGGVSLAADAPLPDTLVDATCLGAGQTMFAVKESSRYIFAERIRAAFPKGSDASNLWDEEIAAEEQEYSDDEAEHAAREAHRSNKRRRPGAPSADGTPADAAAAAAAAAAVVDAPEFNAESAMRGTPRPRRGGGGGGGTAQVGRARAGAPVAFPPPLPTPATVAPAYFPTFSSAPVPAMGVPSGMPAYGFMGAPVSMPPAPSSGQDAIAFLQQQLEMQSRLQAQLMAALAQQQQQLASQNAAAPKQ